MDVRLSKGVKANFASRSLLSEVYEAAVRMHGAKVLAQGQGSNQTSLFLLSTNFSKYSTTTIFDVVLTKMAVAKPDGIFLYLTMVDLENIDW
jgi:hypothetical protein